MDATHVDALGRTEAHLAMLTRGRERATLRRWAERCPELALAPIETPAQLRSWVHSLPSDQADRVLRQLVVAAQGQDAAALLTVLCCLAPGIRTLAVRAAISCDEAVSEIALGILDYPVERRTRVAAGLLLDARNRLHRSAQRRNRHTPLEASLDGHRVARHKAVVTETDDPRDTTPPAQRIVQIVCQAHRQGILNRIDARLILHTRIAGHQVQPIATELGLSVPAAYQRRSRAEARLAQLVA